MLSCHVVTIAPSRTPLDAVAKGRRAIGIRNPDLEPAVPQPRDPATQLREVAHHEALVELCEAGENTCRTTDRDGARGSGGHDL